MFELSVADLQRFTLFNQLDEAILKSLCNTLSVKTASDQEILFKLGEEDSTDYFILMGKIKLLDADNNSKIIESGLPNANHAIAPNSPRKHQAISIGDTTYFTIDRAILDHASKQKKRAEDTILFASLQNNNQDESETIFKQFEHEISRGHFVLPSFPETALKIRQKIDQQDCEIADVINLILTDPGISAKLIKTANSSLYRGVNECSDITSAVMRLGLNTTKQLVISFAILNLFDADSPFLKRVLEELRNKSIQLACLAFVLAEDIEEVNQEEALLAGLLSGMGQLIIISYAEQLASVEQNPSQLGLAIAQLEQTASKLATQHWQFPDSLQQAMLHNNICNTAVNNNELETSPLSKLVRCAKILCLSDIFHTNSSPSAKTFPDLAYLYQQLKQPSLETIQAKQTRFEEMRSLLTL